MMMEWMGHQQILLLCQSVGLGICLGFVFSLCNTVSKSRRHRRLMFICDALFFVIASLITFFFSLAIMDGQLHPLLFGGCLVGFVLQHITIGRYLSRWLYRFGRWFHRALTCVLAWVTLPVRLLFSGIRRVLFTVFTKKEKNAKKTRKKSAFFQKNT